MNKDLQLFTDAINHLIFLTTTDEYGSTRSRGIETYRDFANELNNVGIVPRSGLWTENSLKLFLHKIPLRYENEDYCSDCDIDFIGRCSWEYQSQTTHEEVCEGRNAKKSISEPYEKTSRRSNPYTRIYADSEIWKEHEQSEINRQDFETLKKYKNYRH